MTMFSIKISYCSLCRKGPIKKLEFDVLQICEEISKAVGHTVGKLYRWSILSLRVLVRFESILERELVEVSVVALPALL